MPIGFDTFAYRRNLPHLVKSGKAVFLTFCAKRALIHSERDVALYCCVHDHEKTYFLECAVVMPDHVHMIFWPYEEWSLSRITHRLKSVSAHEMNRSSATIGHIWQHESFDHIIRSGESLIKKIEYVCQNPVRAGLVSNPEEYRWLWRRSV